MKDAAEATLPCPMLCFPQVLFAGAVVPVADMAAPGRVMSFGMTNRWAFESLGRGILAERAAGRLPGVTPYRDVFGGVTSIGWIVLANLCIPVDGRDRVGPAAALPAGKLTRTLVVTACDPVCRLR